MLAAYFKQYPPSLAVIAKQQAENQKLEVGPVMDIDDKALSDTGKTYTLSEDSEDLINITPNGNDIPNKKDLSLELDTRLTSVIERRESVENQESADFNPIDVVKKETVVPKELSKEVKEITVVSEIVTEVKKETLSEENIVKNGTRSSSEKDIVISNKKETVSNRKGSLEKEDNSSPKKEESSSKKDDSSEDDCHSITTFLSSPAPVSSDPSLKLAFNPAYTSPETPKVDPCCPVHGCTDSVRSKSPKASTESQFLHCGICSRRFNNPKILPCLHTFCEKCLIAYCPPESLTLTCPVCRQQSILPKEGVAGLQVNSLMSGMMNALSTTHSVSASCRRCGSPAIKTCVKCNISFCLPCSTTHKQEYGLNHNTITIQKTRTKNYSESADDTTLYCPAHSGQTLRFYCRDCETAVCSSCTDIEHRTHATVRLGDAQEEQRAVIQRLVDRVSLQLPCIKDVVSEISDLTSHLEEKRVYAEGQVRSYFKALHSLLEAREKNLLNNINTVAQKKQRAMDSQRADLEEWIEGVESGCEFLQKAMDGCPAMGLVLVRKQLGEKLMDYADRNLPQAPAENAHLQFITGNTDSVKRAIDTVGTIRTSSAVPHQTTALIESLSKAVIGRCVRVTVLTRDQQGRKLTKGEADVDATLFRAAQPATNGHCHAHTNGVHKEPLVNGNASSPQTPVKVRIEDNMDGSYDVVFTPNQLGHHILSIKLFGQQINASPFKFTVYNNDDDILSQHSEHCPISRQLSRSTQRTSKTSTKPSRAPSFRSSGSRKTNPLEDDLVLRIGRRGRSKGELVNPQGICYNPVRDGRIAVADSNNQCVQVFTTTGESKLKFGIRGRKAGQLQRPTGVTVLPNNNYVVADYENKWVSIFEPTGKYLYRIGQGKLMGPKGVCADSKGNILVVDNKSSAVCVFTSTGKLLGKFGNRGLDENSFAGPHFVAVNSKSEIVVTDFHNHCVRVFDCQGDFLFTFGSNGEGIGQFNAPTGVAVDSRDNIIVADWGNSRIQIFDSEGSFLSYVNTQLDPLYGPQGLTLTEDGHIVVADSGNHCVKMYKYLQ